MTENGPATQEPTVFTTSSAPDGFVIPDCLTTPESDSSIQGNSTPPSGPGSPEFIFPPAPLNQEDSTPLSGPGSPEFIPHAPLNREDSTSTNDRATSDSTIFTASLTQETFNTTNAPTVLTWEQKFKNLEREFIGADLALVKKDLETYIQTKISVEEKGWLGRLGLGWFVRRRYPISAEVKEAIYQGALKELLPKKLEEITNNANDVINREEEMLEVTRKEAHEKFRKKLEEINDEADEIINPKKETLAAAARLNVLLNPASANDEVDAVLKDSASTLTTQFSATSAKRVARGLPDDLPGQVSKKVATIKGNK